MEYDLFFLLQDEPALHAEKQRKSAGLAHRQQQRRGSLDPSSIRRPAFQAATHFPQPQSHHAMAGGRVVEDNERGGTVSLFASVGRVFKSFAAGPSPSVGGEWTPATVSPRRERRNSI
ncbi:uncharacterized protein ACA1_389370 [Acanthamoeba castellanii str. Neff]|jgi:hypothetical protein|uniref:Uncharacterized protein n=1 Tax=Acanthamoeba castellanii (strain ATCC 30010 / Neff) TaxID=1257118 RepID=L8GGA3_ACACF|nr:uncharacterized protein ACA1_389370 [Acanthamoeba castellanii str. Neff]ELR11216.1 hypothetical protein ACA1_389370 [Acanthamoeba castellanii str. Neff]